MAYQALYRKYRPRTFDDVIGQEHITTVLKNQILSGHVAHAYLFCGTRGTGKTSTAKILARAVNCISSTDGNPCEKCGNCIIGDNESIDIVELDAASNNGVADVRMLMDKASFLPLRLRTKVYIIDEAHMLSTPAFNALLKTLEEPPQHVMFILATTEPQKLPATIISHCQRFDFKRISAFDIVKRLKIVLKDAESHISDDGLLAIARAADGSMRDALSLSDQCISFCGRDVSTEMVYSVLGSADTGCIFSIADAVIDSDTQKAMRQLNEIVLSGRDLSVFVHDLASHMRALLMAKLCGNCCDMLDCTEEVMKSYIAQSQRCTVERLVRVIELLLKTQSDMRWLTLPRVLIENTLVIACLPEECSDILSLLDRVSGLEARINGSLHGASYTRESGDSRLEDRIVNIEKMLSGSFTRLNPLDLSGDETDLSEGLEPTAIIEQAEYKVKMGENLDEATRNRLKDTVNKLMDELKGSVPIAWPILMQRKSAWFEDGYLKIGFTQSGFVDQLNTANLKNEVAQALKRIDPTLKLGFVHLRYQEDFSELNNLFGNMLDFEE